MTRQEFISFIEREGKAVYSFCHVLAGNRDEADDLYQETMLAAVERCSDINGSDNPKSYLIGIAVNFYRSRRRKYARRQRIAPMGEFTQELSAVLADERIGPEERVIADELCGIVRQETELLPEKLKCAVYLYYTAQLSVEEIAGILHIPSGTVKSRLHKARNIIKNKLEDYGYEN